MFEVYCIATVKRHKLAYAYKLLCVELYTSRNTRYANNIGRRNFRFPRFNSRLVHIKYASNMAAWCTVMRVSMACRVSPIALLVTFTEFTEAISVKTSITPYRHVGGIFYVNKERNEVRKSKIPVPSLESEFCLLPIVITEQHFIQFRHRCCCWLSSWGLHWASAQPVTTHPCMQRCTLVELWAVSVQH